jgi:hypothetical protein
VHGASQVPRALLAARTRKDTASDFESLSGSETNYGNLGAGRFLVPAKRFARQREKM